MLFLWSQITKDYKETFKETVSDLTPDYYQRSLGGNRDSEIAVGGFQPDHLAEFGDPRGGVHTYRMALWSAHLGGHDEAYLNPARYGKYSRDRCYATYL